MRLKLAFILPFSSKSSFRTLNLAKAFSDKILIAPSIDQFGNKTTEPNIIKLNRKYFGLSLIIPIYKILKKEKPNLIFYTKPTIFSVFSCVMYKLYNKKVKIIADYDEYEPATSYSNNRGISKYIKPIIHLLIHGISNLIANGFVIGNKNLIRKIPKNKPFVYIPNAADPEKIKPAKNKKHKIFSIFYFGNIFRNKQINFLLELSNEFPDYKFVFVGKLFDESLKEKYSKAVFLGEYKLENMSELAAEADVLLAFFDKTPANQYTSNMKVFDYMCLQKPIIVSDVGELKEYIHYPKGGYVVKPGDKEELKRTIEYIKAHYKEAMKKAKYARKLAETVESWKARRKKFKEFIKRFL